jgi:hypothetical protein
MRRAGGAATGIYAAIQGSPPPHGNPAVPLSLLHHIRRNASVMLADHPSQHKIRPHVVRPCCARRCHPPAPHISPPLASHAITQVVWLPVMALVGTTLTNLRGSGFFQYSDTFRPCTGHKHTQHMLLSAHVPAVAPQISVNAKTATTALLSAASPADSPACCAAQTLFPSQAKTSRGLELMCNVLQIH